MNCPHCHSEVSAVIDSRADALLVRRRRQCVVCRGRWTTYEMDTATIERLKGNNSEYAHEDDLLAILDAAVEMVVNRKRAIRESVPLLRLHGNRYSAPPPPEIAQNSTTTNGTAA